MARRPPPDVRAQIRQRLRHVLDRSWLRSPIDRSEHYSVPLHEVEGWYEEIYEDPFEIVDPDEFYSCHGLNNYIGDSSRVSAAIPSRGARF